MYAESLAKQQARTMSRLCMAFCWAALALLLAAVTAWSQDPLKRTDPPGDLLASSIQARFGTSQLRHEQAVQAVVFSPDGRFIASSARDFSIRIWDRLTGGLVHSLIRPTNRLAYDAPEASTPCLLYSPDGTLLLAGRGDGKLLVWETQNYKLRNQLTGSTGAIHALAIAPNNKMCATADTEQIVRLWDLDAGKELKQITLTDRAEVLLFSPAGKQLIAGCSDGSIRTWELDPLMLDRTIEAHNRAVQHLAMAPTGGIVASAGPENEIRFWNIRPEANPQTAPLVWSVVGGSPQAAFTNLFAGLHYVALIRQAKALKSDGAPISALAYLSSGALLQAGPDSLTLWDVTQQKQTRRIVTGPLTCMAVDKTGSAAATGDANGVIRIWNLLSGQEIVIASGPLEPPTEISLAPGASKVAVAYRNGQVFLWDRAGGSTGTPLGGTALKATTAAISPDALLVAQGAPKGIAILDLPAAKLQATIPSSHKVTALALSPGNHPVAVAADNNTLAVSSLDGRLLWRLDELREPLRNLLFSPDGKVLAGCSGNDTLILWDAASGKELRRLVESGSDVLAAAISPDGTLAAVGHPDGTVRIWRTATGQLDRILEGHPGPVQALAFSRDGRMLAAGSWLTLKLWEVATGKERLRVHDLPGLVTAAAFTPAADSVFLGMSTTQSICVSVLPADLEGAGWTSKELDALWGDLENADAARAYRALTLLRSKPDVAIPLLRERLKPLVPLNEAQRKEQAAALAKLGSESFQEREKAVRTLEQLGDAAEPGLRELLAQSPTSEVRFRVEEILNKLQLPERQRQRWRGLRSCEILERIGNADAKKLLAALAAGAAGTWLTDAARQSLQRLEK